MRYSEIQYFPMVVEYLDLDETCMTTVQKPRKLVAPKGHKNLCKVTSGEINEFYVQHAVS